MSEIPFIRARDAAHLMSWPALCDAMEQAHRGARAEIRDTLLARGGDRVLSRAAWIDGLGFGVKTASVFPENPSVGRPQRTRFLVPACSPVRTRGAC
jgi:ornithine cyclodeaminase